MSYLYKMIRGGNTSSAIKKGSRIRDWDAHSPMFKTRNFNEERRTKMFSDKPFVWGRWPKYLLVWGFSMTFWAGYHIN